MKIKKIDLVYFLDFSYRSIVYADLFLKNNKNSYLAIANKNDFSWWKFINQKNFKTKNNLIPLDSEHFSLFNYNLKMKI